MRKHLRLTHAVLASTLLMAPLAYADVTINTVNVNRDTQTSVDGNITIDTTGQLWMNAAAPNGGTAILVNSNGPTITLNANNQVNVNCAPGSGICTTPAGTSGINISGVAGGQSATIVVGTNSNITAATAGIYVDGPSTSIENSGNIIGNNGSAVDITANGLNTGVYNYTGATLTGAGFPTIAVNGQNAYISNSGTITAVGAIDAIQINQNFSAVSNNTGGTIQTVAGAGIDITAGMPVAGDIVNLGTITTINGTGVNLQQTLNGTINNASNITVTGAGGNAFNSNLGFMLLYNSGAITAAPNSTPVSIQNTNLVGTITNTGNITGDNLTAVRLDGNLTQLNNSGGTISVLNSMTPVISAGAGVDVINGINNTGTITNILNGTALDLSAGDNIVLTQAGGLINGDIFLASQGGNIFTLSGGTITGDVTASNMNPNIHTLSGGTLMGTLQLGNAGDIVNISGSAIDTITGGAGVDTVNQSGGSLTTLNANAGDVYNISGTATAAPGSVYTVGTINLLSPGSFTNNGAAIATNLLTLAAGSSFTNNAVLNLGAAPIQNNGSIYANEDLTAATLTNGGLYIAQNDSVSTITGLTTNTGILGVGDGSVFNTVTFNQPLGYFAPEIYAPGANGLMQVGAGGATLAAGSFVFPRYTSGIYIPIGSTFDVLTSAGALVDNSEVSQPDSVSLFFIKSNFGGNTIRLTAARRPLVTLVEGQPAKAVAEVLDQLSRPPVTTDPTLLTILGQIDTLTSGSALETALNTLTPTANYALVQGSKVSIDSAFESVLYRIEKMKNLKPLGAEEYTVRNPSEVYRGGMNYGDGCCPGANSPPTNSLGAWFKVYGSLLDQKTFKNFSGYKGDSVGYAVGADWGNPDTAIAGAALSYTNTHTVNNNEAANIIDIQSVQGTFYAWVEPIESVYIDAMFGFAQHKYYSRRNIAVGTFTTAAFGEDFYGTQYAVQTDLGYAFTYDYLIVAPVARFKYGYLGVDSYTETGAGGASLSVENKSIKEMVAGAGIRILGHKTFAQAQYNPEISAMILYDFDGDGQELSSNFIGGGGFFPTEGPNPSHTSYLYGLGITAYTYDNYSFQIKYNLQIGDRYHFYANSGFMQLRGEWG